MVSAVRIRAWLGPLTRHCAALVARWLTPLSTLAGGAARFKANVKEAVSSLAEMGGRSVLALIGIAVGIGAVIAMVSTGEIVKEETLRQFRALGTDIVSLRQRYSEKGGTLSRADMAMLPAAVPDVLAVAPWMSSHGAMAYRGREVGRGELLGVTESFAALHRLTLAEGRFVSDLDRGQRFCVVGHTVAEGMRALGAKSLIGEEIRFDDRLYTVIGVLGLSVGSAQGVNVNTAILLPMSTAAGLGLDINLAIMRLRSGTDAFAAAREVRAYFKRVAPDVDLEVTSARELIEQMQRQAQMFTLLFTAVGSISLIVGGVGVMNVMLMSITERRGEIGLRRSLGARRRDIMAQFLTESALLCLLGGVAGIIMGTAAAWGISRYAGWLFFVSMSAAVLGVGVSTAVGLFFGFYPARHAARLDPIIALRA